MSGCVAAASAAAATAASSVSMSAARSGAAAARALLAAPRQCSVAAASPCARAGHRAPLMAATLHTSAAAWQAGKTAAAVGAKATPAKPGSAGAAATKPGGGAGGSRPAGDAFDFHRAVVARHQVVVSPPPAGAAPPPTTWTPASRRVGVLALKAGMTADWDKWGARRALTVLKLEDVVVTGVATEAARGYTAVQVGAGTPKLKNVAKPQLGYFAAQGVPPRSVLSEFRVTADAVLPVGTALDVRHFVPGQFVDVRGTSQGKGFQGAMKRHNFAGQRATHGNSVSHRVLGSTGQRQDPGHVIKGKKMPGHMGEDTVTVECLRVYKLDIKRGLVFVEGAVPGKPGTVVRLRDAPKKPFTAAAPPPFPTYARTAADDAAAAKWAAGAFLPLETELALRLAGQPLPAGAELEPPFELVAPPPAVDPFAVPEDDEGEPA